ncbi:MAG: hypothetical protein HEQ10_03435 [Dolichospermum sp. DEX182a]|nr:hypothetical protein [Dolichospermum sp. DEX182a]
MQLVLNILEFKSGKKSKDIKPVEVVYVATMSKGKLMKYLQQALEYPDRYVFANAEAIDTMEDRIPASDLITLQEYLDEHNIVIELADKQRLANKVAQIYVAHYKAKPRIIARKNAADLYRNKSYGYEDSELWVFTEALKTVKYLISPNGK